MKYLLSVLLVFAILSFTHQPYAKCQTQILANDSAFVKEVLDVFVGEWEGHSTAYFPRDKDRPNREETVKVVGTKVLNGNYIQCISNWLSIEGRNRELFIYFNFDKKNSAYKVLFLYDDWGEIVHYPLTYNTGERIFRGIDTFTISKGIKGEEHVEWWISEDGDEIKGKEFNHYETDPDDYWPMSFEFVWKRK